MMTNLRFAVVAAVTLVQLQMKCIEGFHFQHRHRWLIRTVPIGMVSSTDDAVDNTNQQYDLAVIGAGVVGVQAALTASQSPFNKRVVLIDAPRASGMLMNEKTGEDLSLGAPTGLFSKALRDTSKRISVSTLLGMGLREDSVWNEIVNSCVDLATFNSQDMIRQLNQAKVDYWRGMAAFSDATTHADANCMDVQMEDGSTKTISADNVLIATGSKPFRPDGIPFDGRRIFDSDSINTISYLPKSIAITGSGIIAVEFAKIFRNLGSDVTLIIRDSVPKNALIKIGMDKDVAATLVADLVRSGIVFKRGAQVKSFEKMGTNKDEDDLTNRSPIKVTLEARGGGDLPAGYGATDVLCDAYVAAVGRVPNTGKLNLQAAGIDVDIYGGILVDARLRTSSKSGTVYAAGDVVGRPFLASTGMAQGKAAVSAMFNIMTTDVLECSADDPTCSSDGISQVGECFDPASLASNPFAFPTAVWSSPEAAYYGLSLGQAKDRGIDAGESISLYTECLRGLVFSPNGMLKLVFERPSGRIIGVHICGDDACELIHFGMECVKGRRTIMDLKSSIFSAVTYHEMYRIAAQAALNESGARKRRAAAGAALAKRNRKLLAKDTA